MPNGVSLVSFVFNSLVKFDLLKLYNITMMCKECEQELDSIITLREHVESLHNISLRAYSLKHDHSGTRPLCKCGCGQETPWHDCRNNYTNYLKGHSIKLSGITVNCYECNKQMDEESLGKHLRTHKMLLVDYIIKYELDGIRPVCECGCGEETKWINNIRSFSKTIDGHDDRVERNAKISATVKKIYDDPEKRAETSRLTKAGMDNEETKSKISKASASRAISRVSQAEIEFVGKLTELFKPEIITHPFHMTFGHVHLVIDSYIACLDVYVEFDGTYWHCLNLRPGKILTHKQCNNASADLRKNRLFREKKLTLIRIAEGLDISGLEPTLESLIKYSHYTTADGIVLKDEMPMLSIDKIRESSKSWKNSSDVERLISKYEAERSLVMSHV
jgi:hypothetical protein